jgi:hypothetical protein
MAFFAFGGKLYEAFTTRAHSSSVPEFGPAGKGLAMLVGIALAMFVALVGWGSGYFGWSDPEGKVQLALFTTFILGALCGYKSKA